MANPKLRPRQWPLSAVTPVLGIANIGANLGYDVTIPPNAYVDKVEVFVPVAFDGTTVTVTVTDGTTVFASAVSVKSTGPVTMAVANKYYPSGGVISFNIAQTGTSTVGQAIGRVNYVGLDRENELVSN